MVTIPYWLIRYAMPAGLLMLATVAILVARPSYEVGIGAPSLRQAPTPGVTSRPAGVMSLIPRQWEAIAMLVPSGDQAGSDAPRVSKTRWLPSERITKTEAGSWALGRVAKAIRRPSGDQDGEESGPIGASGAVADRSRRG